MTELIQCNRDCQEIGIDLVVIHAYKGFEPNAGPNVTGIENFRKVVEDAKARGIKVAFENTEGEEYLAALMEAFKDYDNVGFCWDTGHEKCYNWGEDMMAGRSHRLIAMHLNDNLGVRKGVMTSEDDLHLLPFDGNINYENMMRKLDEYHFDGPLILEVNTRRYPDVEPTAFLADCYARIQKIAAL